MPGDDWQKAATLRAYYGFMWGHPGKKLLFMGGEFGQRRECNHDRSLDWHLLDEPNHKGIQTLVRYLNLPYRSLPALHQLDCNPEGFELSEGNARGHSLLGVLRRRHARARVVVCVSTFTRMPRHGPRS